MNFENPTAEGWQELLFRSLKAENINDRTVALDFMGQQNSLSLETCRQLLPIIQENILHPDTQIRYFARKAKNHLLECFPEMGKAKKKDKDLSPDLDLKEGETLTAQQILLHKLRLGSRYVVFEALERLTESGDSSIVAPLIEFLEKETDEYKISYLFRVLGRIDDPRIPPILIKYLDHEDPRIVANALESLCCYDIPKNVDKLLEFSTNSDNRIRANAVKGLFKYSPNIAEKHISEMMNSSSIALQASAVYLLKTLRPSNLTQLLEVAHGSRYATVRINALDIAPPSSNELELNEFRKTEDLEQPNPTRDLFLMDVFLVIGVITILITDTRNKHLLSLAFLGVATLMLLMHEKTRTSVQKMALSMGFISSLAWGNTRLMILPALMGLWLTLTGNQINKRGKFEKAKVESLFAWFFALGAIIITQLIQNEMAMVLSLAQKIAEAARNVPQPIAEIVSRQGRFDIIIFVAVSAMTILILKLNSWFPSKSAREKPFKKLIIASVICLGIILLINLSHVFGIQLQIKVNGLQNTLGVLKKLLP